MSPAQRYPQMAHDLRSSMSLATCRWLNPEDVGLVGERPIAAGGFANIYEATYDGRKVVLKSYRCYVSFDVAQIISRFHNEVRACTLLHHGDVEVVPLVGVYSTDTHPFCLVYEYMDGLDLRQHLRSEPNVGRLELLAGIARNLSRIHDLGIIHGNLQTTNIVVDGGGTARIAGLGNVSILSHSTAGTADDRTTPIDTLVNTPELAWSGILLDLTDPTHPTTADDMYAFGVVAWEVLTGLPPFFGMTEVATMYLMQSGEKPPRPSQHEISDRVWCMIEWCWHDVSSERTSVGEAVDILETELRRR